LILVRRACGTADGSMQRGPNGAPDHAGAQHCPWQQYALHLPCSWPRRSPC